MAAKARAVIPDQAPSAETAQAALQDMVFFALPASLFKQLSDAAAQRQMTLAQLLSTAVSSYLLTGVQPTNCNKEK